MPLSPYRIDVKDLQSAEDVIRVQDSRARAAVKKHETEKRKLDQHLARHKSSSSVPLNGVSANFHSSLSTLLNRNEEGDSNASKNEQPDYDDTTSLETRVFSWIKPSDELIFTSTISQDWTRGAEQNERSLLSRVAQRHGTTNVD